MGDIHLNVETSSLLVGLETSFYGGSQLVGMLLGVGLGVLTVSLLVLMRTRWGQAKPLSKCVALSVFAHILLFGYAYATRLILDAPATHHDNVIQFRLESPEMTEREPTEDLTQPEPEPWDNFADTPEIEPGAELSPQSVVTAAESDDLQPEWPTIEDVLGEQTLAVVADQPAQTMQPSMATPNTVRPERDTAPAPIEIAPQTPAPAKAVADKAQTPEVAAPERMADAANVTNDQDHVTRSPTPQPASMLDVASQLQRLLDDANEMESEDSESQSFPRESVAANQVGRAPRGDLTSAVAVSSAEGEAKTTMLENTNAHQAPRRIGDGEPLPEMFEARMGMQRQRKVAKYGGSETTELAVQRALEWLAANQSPSGAWIARDYGAGLATENADQDRDRAGADADTGITGLALLAFLANGNTHLEGPYRDTVRAALEYLLEQQQSTGDLSGRARLYAKMYCHSMASLALSEAWAMSGDRGLQEAVQRAVAFTVAAQHPQTGGWRYQPGDRGDMSQFGWQLMALKSAELAGAPTPASTRSGMVRFLRSVSSGRSNGLGSYRPGEGPSRTMTAEALLCRVMLGEANRPAAIQEATDFVLQELPGDGPANLYYWYYGSLALFQVQGEPWRIWNEALTQQLLTRQRQDGPLRGSWDPDTRWGAYGGRVYSTAMGALSLEVYYRYLPILK